MPRSSAKEMGVMHLKKPLIKFYKNSRYNDEPQLFQYTAISEGNVWGGGISFDKKRARNKAIGESIERYCLEVYDKESFLYFCTDNFKKIKTNFLDPYSVSSLSPEQKKLKKFQGFILTDRSKFNWTMGKSLINNKKVYIPAQLVYVPYIFSKSEPILRFPISTGAALGTDIDSAISRGIFEVIERDSFMTFYLNRINPPEVDLEKSPGELRSIKQYFCRYKLNLRLFDITSDLGVSVFMAILIDNTGIGPWISVGLKSGFNKEDAAIGAIEEAQHTRGWMRDERSSVSEEEYKKIIKNPKNISNTKERGLFWYHNTYATKLNFWLNSENHKKSVIYKEKSLINETQHYLIKIKKILKNKNLDAYYTDITTPEVSKLGLFVVKVIIPELQPLYLDEKFPYLGGKRLNEVPRKLGCMTHRRGPKLNDFPHPFL